MSLICMICYDELIQKNKDSLTELVDCDTQDFSLVTTVCGHLFHNTCLINWFQVEDDESGESKNSCPYCKNDLSTSNQKDFGFHRVYPVFAEFSTEEDEDNNLLGHGHGHGHGSSNIQKLQSEIKYLNVINSSQMETNKILETELSNVREKSKKDLDELLEVIKQSMDLMMITKSLDEENKTLKIMQSNLLKNMESKFHKLDIQDMNREKQKNIQSTEIAILAMDTITARLGMASTSDSAANSYSTSLTSPLLPPKFSMYKEPKTQRKKELQLGDRVLYKSLSIFAGPLPYSGIVKSFYLNRFGRRIVGVEFDKNIPHGMSSLLFMRQYFDSRPKHSRFIEDSRLTKIEH